MTIREFIEHLRQQPDQDKELQFTVKDKYSQEQGIEFDPDQIFNYPMNTWITFDLDDVSFLEE